MMCYVRSCRMCLKELKGPGIDCFTIAELRETIFKLFDVEIRRSDSSRSVCNSCFENIMSFKAYKKSVAECQKIITDYERIKRKVLETRVISIKQEVIDLSDADDSTPVQPKRKRNAVTDTQINDILSLVHDQNTTSNSILTVTNPPAKTPPTSNTTVSIKVEPQIDNTPVRTDSAKRVAEPLSTTKDITDKVQSNNSRPVSSTTNELPRSDSICSTSTSGIGSSLDTSKVIAKKEPQNTSPTPKSIQAPEPVSSSVQSPSSSTPNPEPTQPQTAKQSTPKREKKRPAAKTPPKTNEMTTLTKEQYNCPNCAAILKTQKEYNIHLSTKHNQSRTEQTQSQNFKEEIPMLSTDETEKIEPTPKRARSCRQAKSQALKKMGKATKQHRASISPGGLRRSGHMENLSSDHHNNTVSALIPPPTTTSSPRLNTSQSPLAIAKRSLADLKTSKVTEEVAGEQKRIITITLVRCKENLIFRYCDQFNKSIDFSTVSTDELCDIRKSLMIPEISTNLRNVFQRSPPDSKTVDQLKTIFGEMFHL